MQLDIKCNAKKGSFFTYLLLRKFLFCSKFLGSRPINYCRYLPKRLFFLNFDDSITNKYVKKYTFAGQIKQFKKYFALFIILYTYSDNDYYLFVYKYRLRNIFTLLSLFNFNKLILFENKTKKYAKI